jgi:multidrug efflux system membrane fusion protein
MSLGIVKIRGKGLLPGRWPLLALALLLLLPGCSDSNPAGAKSKGAPVPVSVATSSRRDVPITVAAIGSVEPFASVGIKSRVAGVLEKVAFREGDRVKAGDLLFRIDQRPYTARLNEALATLAKDRAALDNAEKQAARYLPAAEKGYVSAEQADQAQTSVATMKATVQADEASVASARLDLDDCTIRAPLSGYTGALLADQGNLIKAEADQPLVTINQVTPIKVSFTLAEQSLAELKQYLAAGTLAVRATPSGYQGQPLVGQITFLDNAVDPGTGTIRLKATFANPKQVLWPGQFVHLSLRLTTRKDATVIPARAVQNSQSGNFVYVVGKDQTVAIRPVQVGFSDGNQTVIESGLAVGETVVTDGQLRLAPGVRVKAIATAAPADKTEAPQ